MLVSSFEFRVSSFEFRVPSFAFRVPSSEFRVSSSEFRVPSSEFRVRNSELGTRNNLSNSKLRTRNNLETLVPWYVFHFILTYQCKMANTQYPEGKPLMRGSIRFSKFRVQPSSCLFCLSHKLKLELQTPTATVAISIPLFASHQT
jgi:hypothetical protein